MRQSDEFPVAGRKLVAAIILQALDDALAGWPDAVLFMDQDAPALADRLGLPRQAVAAWHAAQPADTATRRRVHRASQRK